MSKNWKKRVRNMVTIDDWKIYFRERKEEYERWKEIHEPKETYRIDRLELGEYKEQHMYRQNYVNKPFILLIDITYNGEFIKYGGKNKYKKFLSSVFPKIETYYEKYTDSVFFGFNTLGQMMEHLEEIKERIQHYEI